MDMRWNLDKLYTSFESKEYVEDWKARWAYKGFYRLVWKNL